MWKKNAMLVSLPMGTDKLGTGNEIPFKESALTWVGAVLRAKDTKLIFLRSVFSLDYF